MPTSFQRHCVAVRLVPLLVAFTVSGCGAHADGSGVETSSPTTSPAVSSLSATPIPEASDANPASAMATAESLPFPTFPSSADALASGDWVATPGGIMYKDCVHEVPDGATVSADGVVTKDGTVAETFAPCPYPGPLPGTGPPSGPVGNRPTP